MACQVIAHLTLRRGALYPIELLAHLASAYSPFILAYRWETVNEKPLPRSDYPVPAATRPKSVDGGRALGYTKGNKGGDGMQVEVKLDPERKEIGIVILAPAPSPEVEELVRRLEAEQLSPLRGWQEDTLTLLPQSQVVRCYAQDKRVYAAVDGGAVYLLQERLYELEEQLDRHRFVRISNGEIINLDKVTAVDLSLTGTIRMTLGEAGYAYVSRRYVKKIKETLKVERRRPR